MPTVSVTPDWSPPNTMQERFARTEPGGWYPMIALDGQYVSHGWQRKMVEATRQFLFALLRNGQVLHTILERDAKNWYWVRPWKRDTAHSKLPPYFKVNVGFGAGKCPFAYAPGMGREPSKGAWLVFHTTGSDGQDDIETGRSLSLEKDSTTGLILFRRPARYRSSQTEVGGPPDLQPEETAGVAVYEGHLECKKQWHPFMERYVYVDIVIFQLRQVFQRRRGNTPSTSESLEDNHVFFDVHLPVIRGDFTEGLTYQPLVEKSPYSPAAAQSLHDTVCSIMWRLMNLREKEQATSAGHIRKWGWSVSKDHPEKLQVYWSGACLLALAGAELPRKAYLLTHHRMRSFERFCRFERSGSQDLGIYGKRTVLSGTDTPPASSASSQLREDRKTLAAELAQQKQQQQKSWSGRYPPVVAWSAKTSAAPRVFSTGNGTYELGEVNFDVSWRKGHFSLSIPMILNFRAELRSDATVDLTGPASAPDRRFYPQSAHCFDTP